jgi:hypothetical protein
MPKVNTEKGFAPAEWQYIENAMYSYASPSFESFSKQKHSSIKVEV